MKALKRLSLLSDLRITELELKQKYQEQLIKATAKIIKELKKLQHSV